MKQVNVAGRPHGLNMLPVVRFDVGQRMPNICLYVTRRCWSLNAAQLLWNNSNSSRTNTAYAEKIDFAAPEASTDEWVQIGIVGPTHGVRGEFKVQPLTDFPETRLEEPGVRWIQAPAPRIGRQGAPEPEEVELEWGRRTVSKASNVLTQFRCDQYKNVLSTQKYGEHKDSPRILRLIIFAFVWVLQGREVWLVKLKGVESPEEATLLRGRTLLIPSSAREPLDDDDEFYVQELVGLRVELLSSGKTIGKVVDLFDGTGTHDVLRIEMTDSAAPQVDNDNEDVEPASLERRHVMVPFARQFVPDIDLAAGVMKIDPPEGLLELAVSVKRPRERKESAGRREKRQEKPKKKLEHMDTGSD